MPARRVGVGQVAPSGPNALVESRFEAMGTRCHVMLIGADPKLLSIAEADIRWLQRIWTRFEPDSELSRLNARGGHVVAVGPELALLIQRSCFGHALTDGYFDPFLGAEVIAAGYDRDFDLLAPANPRSAADQVGSEGPLKRNARRHRASRRRRADRPVQLDVRRRLVRLQPGALIDSGGLGKGLGADLVSASMIRNGASGALVNLGGDLRVRGVTPEGGWRISLDDPFDAAAPPHSTVTLHSGGVCTSTPLRRTWQGPDGATANHIIDPRTRRPLASTTAAVTAIATAGWLAEVWAKAALVAGPRRAERLLRRSPTSSCVVVGRDGSVSQIRGDL